MIKIQSFISGIISFVPGGNDWLFNRRKRMRKVAGTLNGEYCYSVWLRHLILARKHGVLEGVPETVAELGPGNSLGTGLAALLSGVQSYYAFDVVDHTANADNLKIFDQLIMLFKDKKKIPDSRQYPQIITELENYDFPKHILNDEILEKSLCPKRIEAIREDLQHVGDESWTPRFIHYAVPWNDTRVVKTSTIDMLFSMSVLEHVDDLELTYRAMYEWLKKGGVMSHEIDFKCHGHSHKWNGHWACPDFAWQIIRGNRPFLLNREPHSTHLHYLRKNGFEIIVDRKKKTPSDIDRKQLASQFLNLSEEDLTTSNAFILSRKL